MSTRTRERASELKTNRGIRLFRALLVECSLSTADQISLSSESESRNFRNVPRQTFMFGYLIKPN